MRVLSRRAINRIKSQSSSIPYRKANYANSGLKTKIIFSTSINNKSSLNKDRGNIGSTAIIIFTNFSLKFSSFLAFIFMLLTLFSSIYTVIVFFSGRPIEGYTTIMLLMSVSFFGVFSILAVIVKYLSVLIELVFSKQNQIVESIEKIS
jgi:dolichol-phosphate mannosyltransferase